MQLRSQGNSDSRLNRLERAIVRARLALASERLWPRLVPILSIVGLYIVLSWLGYWRLGGDWLRLGTLGLLGLALLVTLVWLARVSLPGRLDAMRRVELALGSAASAGPRPERQDFSCRQRHRRADTLGGEQARLHASLKNLRVGVPRPEMASAIRTACASRSCAPRARLCGRMGRVGDPPRRSLHSVQGRAARRDGEDRRMGRPPALYASGAGIPLAPSERAGLALSTAATGRKLRPRQATVRSACPEGSKLTVRVVSRDPAE